MRIRYLLVALFTIAVVFSSAPPASTRFSDGDGDGIDDSLEMYLASSFLPQLRYARFDGCLGPANFPILFRARHPSWRGQVHTDYMAINYVRLYNYDCAQWTGHRGDNEPFVVFLKLTAEGWRFDSVAATAHWGEWICEARSASWQPLLWLNYQKHATYADLSWCDGSCGGHCDWDGPTLPHQLFNVGEPANWLLNDLRLVHSDFQDETVWNDDQFFEAGRIADQLYLTRFAYLTYAPAISGCYATCDEQLNICSNDIPDPEFCSQQHYQCLLSCQVGHRWDEN